MPQPCHNLAWYIVSDEKKVVSLYKNDMQSIIICHIE